MKRKSEKDDKDLDGKSEKDDKSDKNVKNELVKTDKELSEKALFIQRLAAFFIDVILVSFIASFIATPFVGSDEINKLDNNMAEIMNEYIEGNSTINEYTVEYINITYDLARKSGGITIVSLLVGILYYVVFQTYNKGQTIGKKLLKIKVVSTNGDLTMNQMIFRSFIANSIMLDILSLIFVIFASKTIYFACTGLFSMVQYIVTIISVFMIMYSKDGLSVHDRIMHTKVIKAN